MTWSVPLGWWVGAAVIVAFLWHVCRVLTRDFEPPLSAFQYSGTRENAQAIFYAWPRSNRCPLMAVLCVRFASIFAWLIVWTGMVLFLAKKAMEREWLISALAPAVLVAVAIAAAFAAIENAGLIVMAAFRTTRFARLSSLAAEYKIIVMLAVGAYAISVAYAVLLHDCAVLVATIFR